MASISNWNKHRDKERNTERHLVLEKHENTKTRKHKWSVGSFVCLHSFIHEFRFLEGPINYTCHLLTLTDSFKEPIRKSLRFEASASIAFIATVWHNSRFVVLLTSIRTGW